MSPDPGLLGRDARWMRSLGKSEGSEGRNVVVRVEPGGNEPIGANENSPDLMPLGPVGKAAVDVLQRQRPCVLDATVQTNKSCLEGAKNSQVTGGQHGDRTDSDAERTVPPLGSQGALMYLGRWQDPSAADESPEFAGQVEAGKEQVPCRCDDPVRRHDQCAKTARNLDHFPHDW